jgi:hypothetical protein
MNFEVVTELRALQTRVAALEARLGTKCHRSGGAHSWVDDAHYPTLVCDDCGAKKPRPEPDRLNIAVTEEMILAADRAASHHFTVSEWREILASALDAARTGSKP